METQEELEVQGEVPEVPRETPISEEVVQRARMMGHIPKDQFKGDPSKWVDEAAYVERAESLMPILKSQLGKYENEISGLKSTLESQKKTTEKLLKMSETVQQRAYEQAKKDLVREQAQAVADGDVEKWQRLEDQKESLPRPEPIQAEQEVQNPIFNQWHTGNEWYLRDAKMTKYANVVAQELQESNPTMAYEQILKEVEKEIKETFPSRFENPARSMPSAVDTTETRQIAPKSNGKGYNDLPADAKAMCDQNIKQGLFKSKEDWVKVYFEEE